MANVNLRRAVDPAPLGIAERLRTLRKHAGLTQGELAGERFSKEYVSQIELGKTKPSAEAIDYLASQLDVDPLFLETGVSSDERSRIEATLARGEALIEDKHYADAVEQYVRAKALVTDEWIPELDLRALTGEAWARMWTGEVKPALEILVRARDLAERPRFSDIDRADVLYRMGVGRYKLSSLHTAISLFGEALELATSSAVARRPPQGRYPWLARTLLSPAAGLGSRPRGRRARAGARPERRRPPRSRRQPLPGLARSGAKRALGARAQLRRAGEGRVRAAGRQAQLRPAHEQPGRPQLPAGEAGRSRTFLKDSFHVALDNDDPIDAGYAINSLARVQLETGKPELGEEQARKALALLDGREDHLAEIGNAQLVLGRSLTEQDRLAEADEWLRASEASFEQIGSPGHRSAALVARGDLALTNEEHAKAARLYKVAAELLQDVRF